MTLINNGVQPKRLFIVKVASLKKGNANLQQLEVFFYRSPNEKANMETEGNRFLTNKKNERLLAYLTRLNYFSLVLVGCT